MLMTQNTTAQRNIKIALSLAFMAILGFSLGKIGAKVDKASYRTSEVTQRNTTFKYISPLLDCGDYQASNLLNSDAKDIADSIQKYIDKAKSNGLANVVSVYFRDLSNGPYVNIDGGVSFVPGSLLKIPTAISVYRQAESDRSILDRKVTYKKSQEDYDMLQHYGPPKRMEEGKQYTIEDLIGLMLTYSDNNAAVAIFGSLNSRQFIETYTDLGVERPTDDVAGPYKITTKNFASFFRILYNASYLNQEYSEHLLSLLAQSPFTKGLVAGVPKGVVVAHKFGEKTMPDGTQQLHDCGIVYKQNQPYALCIMTQGKDFDDLASVIAHISSIIYTTLDSND